MAHPAARRSVVVVMGVSGSGKTTIGEALARRLGVPYAEADAFHPAANIAKMSAGHPLDDADREPWLAAIAAWIAERGGAGGVVSCSALKRRYRDVLRAADPEAVKFLHLDVSKETILARVAGRSGHFMPVSLVDSQFEALEPLGPDEPGIVVDAGLPPEKVAEIAIERLALA
ncbi:MAG: gluconokinase [Actinomycetia bacterium]|nr:gluconokinase [Actinomycetes bacterium]MDQ1658659.1 gluconokinase [Cryptosporangiaceae bacterium]